MRTERCICEELPLVQTRTRFLILRHAKEIARASNTGRLAALALPNSELLDYGAWERPLELPELPAGAMLLYPGSAPSSLPPRPGLLVVPDGTWQQTRRMVQRLPALQTMPRLSLPPAPPRPRLRRSHQPEGVTTIEAIAGAVELLEGERPARLLYEAHRLHASRVLAARGIAIESLEAR